MALTLDGRPVRLVATDLDGTLLDAEKRVSERTRAAIARVVCAGVPVVIATARGPLTLGLYARAAGVGGVAIGANGGLLFDVDAGRVVRETPIASGVVAALVAGLREALPGVSFGMVCGNRFAAEETYVDLAREVDHGERWLDSTTVMAADEFDADPGCKLLARHVDHDAETIARHAAALAVTGYDVAFSGAPFAEFSAAGVSKGAALADLCAERGIDPAHVLAFGDGGNDAAMLATAGIGVAMAGGHPDAIAAATLVTRAVDDDGVALVLDRLEESAEPMLTA